MSNTIEGYINKQRSPQKEICTRLREIIFKNSPGIIEEMKNGVPWYEGKYYIVALKDHVNLGFSIKGMSKDEVANFSGGGKTAKVLEIFTIEDIDEKKITELMKLVKEPL